MAYQVLIRINKNEIKTLSVASSFEEFQNYTIGQLKERALQFFPGRNDLNRIRVVFGQNELKDEKTFGSCGIVHRSVLVFVFRMPGGPGSPDPGGTEAQRKVNQATDLLGFLKLASSHSPINTEKTKISASQSQTEHYIDTHYERDRRDVQMSSAAQYLPAESSSAQSDPDQQFLQSLLPALKRMDLRRREQTKLRIQQLVFDAEFNDSSDDRFRRSGSMDKLPPYM